MNLFIENTHAQYLVSIWWYGPCMNGQERLSKQNSVIIMLHKQMEILVPMLEPNEKAGRWYFRTGCIDNSYNMYM